MWSVPFNYNIHDSYFAVGMIFNRGRFTSSSYWFNQMYYSEKGPYKRGYGGQNITFENSAIVVHATMEPSTYHPVLNISVLPQVHMHQNSVLFVCFKGGMGTEVCPGSSPLPDRRVPVCKYSQSCEFPLHHLQRCFRNPVETFLSIIM